MNATGTENDCYCDCNEGSPSIGSIVLFVIGSIFLCIGLGLILITVWRRKRQNGLSKPPFLEQRANEMKKDEPKGDRTPVPVPRNFPTYDGDYIEFNKNGKATRELPKLEASQATESGEVYEDID